MTEKQLDRGNFLRREISKVSGAIKILRDGGYIRDGRVSAKVIDDDGNICATFDLDSSDTLLITFADLLEEKLNKLKKEFEEL